MKSANFSLRFKWKKIREPKIELKLLIMKLLHHTSPKNFLSVKISKLYICKSIQDLCDKFSKTELAFSLYFSPYLSRFYLDHYSLNNYVSVRKTNRTSKYTTKETHMNYSWFFTNYVLNQIY